MPTRAIEFPDDDMLAISLRDLRSIVAIAREGSLTAAGAALGFSQATISAHLAAAEAALGVPLFHRHGRGAVPTDAGRAVLRHASTLFSTLRELRADARGLRSTAVTIGATEPAASRRVVAFIRSAERQEPGLELMLRVGNATEVHDLVDHGELELAVTAARREMPRTATFTPLYDQELVVLVPERHRLASARSADLPDLRNDRLLVGDDTCVYRRIVEETLRSSAVDIAMRARFGPITTLPHAVGSGLGIAILPHELVEQPPPHTTVVRLRNPIVIPIGLLLRKDASESARHVGAAVRSYFRDGGTRSAPRNRRPVQSVGYSV